MGNFIRQCTVVECKAETFIDLTAEGAIIDPSLNPTYEWEILSGPAGAGFINDNGDGTAQFYAIIAGCYTLRVRCKYDRNGKVN